MHDHGGLDDGGLALLLAWQVMTAAMMLPGALPAVRGIGRGSGGRGQAAVAELALLAVATLLGVHPLIA